MWNWIRECRKLIYIYALALWLAPMSTSNYITRSGTTSKTFILHQNSFRVFQFRNLRMILRPPKDNFIRFTNFLSDFKFNEQVFRVWCNVRGEFYGCFKSLFIQASCNHNSSVKLDARNAIVMWDRCKLAKILAIFSILLLKL